MSPSFRPSLSAICPASSGWERPEKIISRFCGPRSSQCSAFVSLTTDPSRPGSAISTGVVRLSMLLVDPTFLGFLAWRESGERARRNIIGDHGPRCNPCVVANADRRIERIVDAGPDVAPDSSLGLGSTGFVLEVRGDVSGGDVRILADLGIAEVR